MWEMITTLNFGKVYGHIRDFVKKSIPGTVLGKTMGSRLKHPLPLICVKNSVVFSGKHISGNYLFHLFDQLRFVEMRLVDIVQ